MSKRGVRSCYYKHKTYDNTGLGMKVAWTQYNPKYDIVYDEMIGECVVHEEVEAYVKEIEWGVMAAHYVPYINRKKSNSPCHILYDDSGRCTKVCWKMPTRSDMPCDKYTFVETEAIDKWIFDMGFPPYHKWNKGHRVAFKLAF